MSLVTGLLICLYSAAKITHKTQAITSVAAAWHADATINSLDRDQENPRTPSKAAYLQQHTPTSPFPVASASSGEESDDDESRSEDSVDTSRFASFHVTNISFQKRQALGKHPHLQFRQCCDRGSLRLTDHGALSDLLGEQPSWHHGLRLRRRPDMAARAVHDRVLAGDVVAREDDRHILRKGCIPVPLCMIWSRIHHLWCWPYTVKFHVDPVLECIKLS